ncbi:hypothetical protein H4Q26_018360 [Puccinia striiformis f. sp. tritici PST-130]|nr:hypothetical protein H4Q26_018360 [Puccinia striiformis f. sp. tritici PST-130]
MIASMMHNHSRPPPSFNTGLVKIRLARDLAELEFEVLLLLLLLLLLVMAYNNVHPSQTANFPPVFGILEGV